MMSYDERTAQILNRIRELAALSEEPDAITRVYGSDAFILGRNMVQGWMHEAQLKVWVDGIGNLHGRLSASQPGVKTLVMASHIDTVRNAGMFDGILGVVMAINIVETLSISKTEMPFNIEIIAFCDEEGVRFHSTFLGSRVVAGSFDRAVLQKTDDSGITLAEAIGRIGGDISQIEKQKIAAEDWLGYFEIHIEQGPVLYEKKLPAAVVTAIAGQKRVEIHIKGLAGHAGTVPAAMRRDALCGAAEFVLQIEKLAKASKGKFLATVGKLDITHSASNVIPGDVTCTLDVRSEHADLLHEANELLQETCATICSQRSLAFEWHPVQQTDPVTCDAELSALLSDAVKEVTGTHTRLVSGAGHDAVPVSAVSPVCMLFVRCFEGISHNPLENVEASDLTASLEISERFLQLLIQKYKSR